MKAPLIAIACLIIGALFPLRAEAETSDSIFLMGGINLTDPVVAASPRSSSLRYTYGFGASLEMRWGWLGLEGEGYFAGSAKNMTFNAVAGQDQNLVAASLSSQGAQAFLKGEPTFRAFGIPWSPKAGLGFGLMAEELDFVSASTNGESTAGMKRAVIVGAPVLLGLSTEPLESAKIFFDFTTTVISSASASAGAPDHASDLPIRSGAFQRWRAGVTYGLSRSIGLGLVLIRRVLSMQSQQSQAPFNTELPELREGLLMLELKF